MTPARRLHASLRRSGAVSAILFMTACASGTSGDGATSQGGGGGGGAGATSTTSVTSCTEGTPCDGSCVDLQTDPQNCGDCGRTCVLPHGSAACSAGECALGECDVGFADCDADVENGCELTITCQEGGACATACDSTGGLVCADACAPVCAVPAEACNAEDDDCDGACDQGAIAGCRVAVHRAYNGTNGHLFTTDLAEAQAWGLEAQNFFYLYVDAAADLRPFFRCAKAGTGNFLYSESNDCELTGAPLLTVGFIAPAPIAGESATCGSIPLYRIRNAGNLWHFFTTSAPERDAAVAAGWLDEGVAGFVWTGP
jgi:hypothetical protein